jgi:hypothetical protein
MIKNPDIIPQSTHHNATGFSKPIREQMKKTNSSSRALLI